MLTQYQNNGLEMKIQTVQFVEKLLIDTMKHLMKDIMKTAITERRVLQEQVSKKIEEDVLKDELTNVLVESID